MAAADWVSVGVEQSLGIVRVVHVRVEVDDGLGGKAAQATIRRGGDGMVADYQHRQRAPGRDLLCGLT